MGTVVWYTEDSASFIFTIFIQMSMKQVHELALVICFALLIIAK
jgi:hypothetical protein